MLTTMIAVSESTPGPFGVNIATFVGARTEIKAVRGIGYELRCDDV